ncbi:DUF4082 domain-containing protein [Cryobacterium frigoriphilum]|uniref:DUF4082 domain-containing protein n=1 Tax=Cryobacterium frigoriphilum TaxID=1259150 RepID=A0A4R9A202_9MICO|nr:DUF4082 domain-containing protein [Cryobacterium frigoriphilum]TFD50610.1 DUF4082 domain-containing protein [Cryobacterium frigoriphilum]
MHTRGTPAPSRPRLLWASALAVALVGTLITGLFAPLGVPAARAAGPCDVPIVNAVACENTKAGTPASQWDVSGAGDPTIQGFATDMSVNLGGRIGFKVDTTAASFRIDIYRIGFYGGSGARAIGSVTATTARDQPNCVSNSGTGLVDCGNWSESASWTVPSTAVSGVYIARLVRTSGAAGASHVIFVVRDDASRSDLLFQTSDTTWQAYNQYGGNSLYTGSPVGRAYKVSYNRPVTTRGNAPEDSLFNAEYPMIRWLEANGYDVSYSSGVDSDRRGALIRNHKTFLSVGHDEYWSGNQRNQVEAARDAGVNLAFFSGNEVFWKTRWENSIDGSGTAFRTLVSYKETQANSRIDPTGIWTGTWRDPRFSPPADGGRPENALTGTSFRVNCCTTQMRTTGAFKSLRLWRGTRVAGLAASASTQLGTNTLGYEWDEDPDNGFRPAGLLPMSTTTVGGMDVLQDYGSSYASGSATHSLVQYRAASGALVFGAGTVQWSWGLDGTHDRGSTTPDTAMAQATVNLFADMGSQPATIRAGLSAASATTDSTPPTSAITSPAAGGIAANTTITITGTAADTGGGVVGAVEVSTDGARTWHRATGTTAWTYSWRTPGSGSATIQTRAVDDSSRLEVAGSGVTVTVGGTPPPPPPPVTCPCTLWDPATVPATPADTDTAAVELGTRFRADTSGAVTAVRFYKGPGNTGSHTGRLWSAAGGLLATATFSGETATGWQQASFATPVNLTAGAYYVVSYHAPVGRYAVAANLFTAAGLTRGPLYAPRDGESGANGVYRYGAAGQFPNATFQGSSYYVEPVFVPGTTPPPGPDTTRPTVTGRSPAAGATGVTTTSAVSATFSEAVSGGTLSVAASAGGVVAGTTALDGTGRVLTFTPSTALAAGTAYTVSLSGSADAAGNVMQAVSWTFTTASAPPPPGACPCSLWPTTTVPTTSTNGDSAAVELGVRFSSDVNGFVTGVRFYKGTGNTGTHLGRLWSTAGTQLATATFTGESATGWQQVTFATPVAVTAGTTYIASYYAPVGRYAADANYFATTGVDRAPLHAPVSSATAPTSVYRYGAGGGFPSSTFRATNYWVDVVFTTG